MILFGGFFTSGTYHEFPRPLDDTWAWDGSHWTRLQPGPGPVARGQAAMVSDPRRGVIVLHAGTTNSASIDDTWTWNGMRWLQMSPNTEPPEANGLHLMSWDASGTRVLAFDYEGPWPAPTVDQTWAWDGAQWTQLPTAAGPTGHECCPSALAYDPIGKSTIMFGHSGGLPTTWSFDGSTWKQVSRSGSSSQGIAVATDDANSTVVLYGENGDTWTWDGAKWTALNPAHAPPPRTRGTMAYDPVHRVVLLFGGLAGQAAGAHDLNDLWAWNGQDWTQLA